MKIINTCNKYFGRYFIYLILGFLIPSAIKSVVGNSNSLEFVALTIATFIVTTAYLIVRDLKYFKHEEWTRE
jgi:hypothetical protein